MSDIPAIKNQEPQLDLFISNSTPKSKEKTVNESKDSENTIIDQVDNLLESNIPSEINPIIKVEKNNNDDSKSTEEEIKSNINRFILYLEDELKKSNKDPLGEEVRENLFDNIYLAMKNNNKTKLNKHFYSSSLKPILKDLKGFKLTAFGNKYFQNKQ